MKSFFQLREENLEEAVYDVSWGVGVETQVIASTPQEAIKKAKARILQSKPKLADKKYSDTWEKRPSVHKIRESLEEKSVSKAQQQAAGAALAAKRGEIPVSDLIGASKNMYDNMTEKELEDFAKTKHKGLPDRVKEVEELDISESHFEVGDKVKCIASGMKGKVVEVDPKEKGKYYTVKRDDGKIMKYAPDELKVMNESLRLNEDPWEEIPMMQRQLAYIEYAAEEIADYLTDCDEMCVDPEEWFQNKLAHVHDQMQTLHSYIEGDKRVRMDDEDDMYEETVSKTRWSTLKEMRSKK